MSQYHMTMSREFWDDRKNLSHAVLQRLDRTVDKMLDDPWSTNLHPEKIHHADAGMYSCRVDKGYRVIWKHIKPNDIVLCLVDNHDEAYRRAKRKQFALSDGVIQMADIVDVGAKPVEADGGLWGFWNRKKKDVGLLFVGYKDQELLEMGVPDDVLPRLRVLDDVNDIEKIERLLPEDVYNRLLGIVLDIVERPTVPDAELRQSLERYQGGDDLYRFVDSEEFKRALEGSLEEWMLFLAPPQRALVNRDFNGPARIKGVAGSGKTVVAIHRARHLARQAAAADRKVLFLTYGNRLPPVVSHLLKQLAGDQAPKLNAVECVTIHQWCSRYLWRNGQQLHVDMQAANRALNDAIERARLQYPKLKLWNRQPRFFSDEIRYSIKGRGIASLDEYLALDRSGRGTPLNALQRRAVFDVYLAYQAMLDEQGLCDFDDFILRALDLIESGHPHPRYAAAVVDELQDLSAAVLRLIRHLVPPGRNDLFLVGDGLQRIYPGGYALSQLGIDIVGRSTVLRKNYRNTQEILRAAHGMVEGVAFDDLDEDESPVMEPEYSVRRGDAPELRKFNIPAAELHWVQETVERLRAAHGYQARDFAILYRWHSPYADLIPQYLDANLHVVAISKQADSYFGPGLKHTTFHSAKGLEFKVVFVVGVTDGTLVPRDDWSLKDEELTHYLALERRLLYVAMTRARDRLFLTCSRGQPSRFLEGVLETGLVRTMG